MTDAREIHRRSLEIASGLSSRLAEAIRANGPIDLKRRRTPPLAEALCRAIVGQQLSVKAASTIWQRACDSAGETPLLDHFRCAEPQRLRACGLSGSKAKAVRSIAEAAAAGELDTEVFRRLDHAERSARLTALWGVGQWTADMIGIFHFADPDIWPDGDLAVRNALVKLTDRRRKTVRTAARFAPHRTYLAMHMWQWANTAPVTG